MEPQEASCVMIITCIILIYYTSVYLKVTNSVEITLNDTSLLNTEMSNC